MYQLQQRLYPCGQNHKHHSNPFVQEGMHSVSARDKILREIFSISLAHRDYSSGYVAKFVIEKDKMVTKIWWQEFYHFVLLKDLKKKYAITLDMVI